MTTKLSNICLIVTLVATLVLVGGMFSGFFLEPASRDTSHQIVIWSFLALAAVCGLLMLFMALEPKPDLDALAAPTMGGNIDPEFDDAGFEVDGFAENFETDELGAEPAELI